MSWIDGIPLEARLAVLAALGACLGSLINWAIYTLAWYPRAISPWSAPVPDAPPRRWHDRIPIIGWTGLRREAVVHGPGFWVRPMALEILCAVGLAALYWWEVAQVGLFPEGLLPAGVPQSAFNAIRSAASGHTYPLFLSHVVLFVLMLAASFIDIDEKIIPDTITVSGTLAGLVLAALLPWSLLPHVAAHFNGLVWQAGPDFLRLTTPIAWPGWLDGWPHWAALAVGLGCWWLWCFALMPRVWLSRRGWGVAWRIFVARLARERATRSIVVLGAVGSAGIALSWAVGGNGWRGLLSALVGMAGGGGITWLVRILGKSVLKREAMGFGDVTLMAMIGTFLGWQSCLMIFFIAPFAGLVVGVFQLVFRRESEIPYGPFLCLATALVIVRWAAVWNWAAPVFRMGWIIPLVVLMCMAALPLMLGVWQAIRGAIGRVVGAS